MNSVRVIDMDRLIRAIFWTATLIIIALIIIDYTLNYANLTGERNIRHIANIAREQSIPTWFSSIQVQLVGATLLLTAAYRWKELARWKSVVWVLSGLFFIYVGIDDFAEVHERLGGALERLLAGDETPEANETLLWNPSFSWHTFIAPFFGVCVLGMLAFLWLEFWRLRLVHWLVLGFGCWAVAQGIDFVEGLDAIEGVYDDIQAYFEIERRYLVTHTFKVVEEVLEMFGTTLLWVGFLKYFAHISRGQEFKLQ